MDGLGGTQNVPSARKRAQLSIEALLLFLIFLSLLGASLYLSSAIGASAQQKADYELGKRSFEEFSSKLRSACNMGEGNIRIAKIYSGKARIQVGAYASGGFQSGFSSSCTIEPAAEEFEGEVRIENTGGAITIS